MSLKFSIVCPLLHCVSLVGEACQHVMKAKYINVSCGLNLPACHLSKMCQSVMWIKCVRVPCGEIYQHIMEWNVTVCHFGETFQHFMSINPVNVSYEVNMSVCHLGEMCCGVMCATHGSVSSVWYVLLSRVGDTCQCVMWVKCVGLSCGQNVSPCHVGNNW